MATMIADMIKDAIAGTYDQLKFALKMLRAHDKNLERPQLQNSQIYYLTGVWISFTLLAILIAVALFRWLSIKLEQCGINKETMRTWLQQFLIFTKLHQVKEEEVRNEIKLSIEDFRSMKERLTSLKIQKINKNDVKDIKAGIKMVRSIEEHLKLMKLQKINEEDVKEIKAAHKPAMDAVQAMEEIINNGVW